MLFTISLPCASSQAKPFVADYACYCTDCVYDDIRLSSCTLTTVPIIISSSASPLIDLDTVLGQVFAGLIADFPAIVDLYSTLFSAAHEQDEEQQEEQQYEQLPEAISPPCPQIWSRPAEAATKGESNSYLEEEDLFEQILRQRVRDRIIEVRREVAMIGVPTYPFGRPRFIPEDPLIVEHFKKAGRAFKKMAKGIKSALKTTGHKIKSMVKSK